MQFPVNYDALTSQKRQAVRLAYIKQQGGLCAFCGERIEYNPHKEVTDMPLNMDLFPPGFLRWPIHLHHDHGTGMTQGAVHAYCNAVLFQYYGQ